MATSGSTPFDGELLKLWTKAQNDFIRRAKTNKAEIPDADVLQDPDKWAASVKKGSKSSRASQAVFDSIGSYVKEIQQGLDVVIGIFQVVSVPVPAVAPATVIVQAFASVFQFWVDGHDDADKISEFFKEVKDLFVDISQLNNVLAQDDLLSSLRNCLFNIFLCCLQIYGFAIEERDRRFSEWIKGKFKGVGELDNLFSELKRLKESLSRSLSVYVASKTVEVLDKTNDTHQTVKRYLSAQDRQGILDWLSRPTFIHRHEDLQKDARNRPNTGQWLIESDDFKAWKATNCSRLCRRWKAGPCNMSVEQLLGMMLRQVVVTRTNIPATIEQEWKNGVTDGKTPTEEFLKQQLSNITKAGRFYVVIDAMDECAMENRQRVLNSVNHVNSEACILVTSRLLEQKFLLAKLHMYALKELGNLGGISDTLRKLPTSIDESYQMTLNRIEQKSQYGKLYAFSILGWLSYAMRPLSADELNHALAVHVNGPDFNAQHLKPDRLLPKNEVVSFYCGLVEISVENNVRFIHYSADSFFKQRKETVFSAFRYDIPLACARYLCMNEISTTYEKDHNENAVFSDFSFAKYSAENFRNTSILFETWIAGKTCFATQSNLSTTEFTIVFCANSKRCPTLVGVLIKDGLALGGLDDFEQNPLTIAFKFDFGDVAEILLDNGAVVDLSTQKGCVLLLYAAQGGFDKVVDRILSSTQETQSRWLSFAADLGMWLLTPLILLTWTFKEALVYISSLSLFAVPEKQVHGDEKIHDEEEEKDGSPELLTTYGPILRMAYHGEAVKLQAYLKRFGPVGCPQSLRSTCKMDPRAGQKQMLDVQSQKMPSLPTFDRISKLLVFSPSKDPNPFYSHKEILKYLKSNGAKIDHRGKYENHELYRAASFGNKEMVKVFLDQGVSPSVANIFGWTPIHEASANAHLDCVELLLGHGVNTSPISDVGKTPHDLVNSGEPHYDWPCLGNDPKHYLDGRAFKQPHFGQMERERLDSIRTLLEKNGAKTADQLYKEDKNAFRHVAAGPFRNDSWSSVEDTEQ
ncbi:hypothetical protein CMUS01_06829 [Colletotrichum musicola]|uniref:Fungal STAND N-terminal Goodbye domain-containing protein n=1 Tax=Colletotrichum musicola TaxID=2175873 RepID=A0A8H6KJK1_9PEZI|nr:hypothetical protein CMUS01_06829 [Colletotrichum musicola]